MCHFVITVMTKCHIYVSKCHIFGCFAVCQIRQKLTGCALEMVGHISVLPDIKNSRPVYKSVKYFYFLYIIRFLLYDTLSYLLIDVRLTLVYIRQMLYVCQSMHFFMTWFT